MKNVIMYTAATCPYCDRAKALLTRKGVHCQEMRIDLDNALRDEMIERTGRKTVPQIFIDDFHVGGCDDLYALNTAGKLDALLN